MQKRPSGCETCRKNDFPSGERRTSLSVSSGNLLKISMEYKPDVMIRHIAGTQGQRLFMGVNETLEQI